MLHLVNLTGVWWGDLIIVTAAVLTSIATIWKKGVKPFFRWFRKSWHNVKSAVAIGSTLVDIAQEFQPNGGGSMRDAIDRVESQVDSLQGQVAEHLIHSEARDAEVAAIRAEQTAHDARDIESFAEVHGAVSTVQSAVDRLTEIAQATVTARQ